MHMLDVFQSFIDYCEQPPPAFAGDTPVLGFHLHPPDDGTADIPSYYGIAVLRPVPGPGPKFVLEGSGAASPDPGKPVPSDLQVMVGLHVLISRPNPIETVLQYGGRSVTGGLGGVQQEEDCDAFGEIMEEDQVRLTFSNDTFNRTFILFKTNLLQTVWAGIGEFPG
jgi:hypothetical protein